MTIAGGLASSLVWRTWRRARGHVVYDYSRFGTNVGILTLDVDLPESGKVGVAGMEPSSFNCSR